MSIWKPHIEASAKLKYLGIVEALEADIRAGRVHPGDRLPAQRVIADALDVDLTTVTRAFNEARRRGLIDAHAGALGVLGAFTREVDTIDRHLALIAGTSSCVMALSAEARPTNGVWGPYFGAVLPGVWLNEGGQSATGALLDHYDPSAPARKADDVFEALSRSLPEGLSVSDYAMAEDRAVVALDTAYAQSLGAKTIEAFAPSCAAASGSCA